MSKQEYGHGGSEEMKKTNSSYVYKAIRRLRWKCSRCRANKGENKNYHKPRTDKYKNHRKGII
jgi:hypothetical protein